MLKMQYEFSAGRVRNVFALAVIFIVYQLTEDASFSSNATWDTHSKNLFSCISCKQERFSVIKNYFVIESPVIVQRLLGNY